MSTAGTQFGGFILTSSNTGDVSLWVRENTRSAKAGALVGTFKKGSRWDLQSASTFKSRVCQCAVKDTEVARAADWAARSDYPKTGATVSDFLPSPKAAEEEAFDPNDSKGMLRSLIVPRLSSTSLRSTSTASGLDPWPLAGGTSGSISAKSSVDQVQLPRMPHPPRDVARRKTPRYNSRAPPMAAPDSSAKERPKTVGVHAGLSSAPHRKAVPGAGKSALGSTATPRLTRAQQILEAAGLGSGQRPGSNRGARPATVGTTDRRAPTQPSFAATPVSSNRAFQSPKAPPTNAGGAASARVVAPLLSGKAPLTTPRRRPLSSADGVFKFKRLELKEPTVSYDALMAAPKTGRSSEFDRIMADRHNETLLTSAKRRPQPGKLIMSAR